MLRRTTPPRVSTTRATYLGALTPLIPPLHKGDACNWRLFDIDLIAFAETLDTINGGLHHHCLTDAEKVAANAASVLAGNGNIYPANAAGVIRARPLLEHRAEPEEVAPLPGGLGHPPNADAIAAHKLLLENFDRQAKIAEANNKRFVNQGKDLRTLRSEIKLGLTNVSDTKMGLLFGSSNSWQTSTISTIRRILREEYAPNTLRALDTLRAKRQAPIFTLEHAETRIRQEADITAEMAQIGQPPESREEGLLRLQQITTHTPNAQAGKAAYYAITAEGDRTISGCLTSLAQHYRDNVRPTETEHAYSTNPSAPSRTAYAASTYLTTEEEASDYDRALEQFNAAYVQNHTAFAAAAATSHKQPQQPQTNWTAAQQVARAKALSTTDISTRTNEQRWADCRADDPCVGHILANLLRGLPGTANHCNWQCHGCKVKKGK